jgi:hypothetical protein
MSKVDIEAVCRRHAPQLMELPHVVGVGVGRENDEPVLEVLVDSTLPADETIPSKIEGCTVRVRETGQISAEGDETSPDRAGRS